MENIIRTTFEENISTTFVERIKTHYLCVTRVTYEEQILAETHIEHVIVSIF